MEAARKVGKVLNLVCAHFTFTYVKRHLWSHYCGPQACYSHCYHTHLFVTLIAVALMADTVLSLGKQPQISVLML